MTQTKRTSPEDRLQKLVERQAALNAAIVKQKRIAADRAALERQRKLLAAGAVVEASGLLDRLDEVVVALAHLGDKTETIAAPTSP